MTEAKETRGLGSQVYSVRLVDLAAISTMAELIRVRLPAESRYNLDWQEFIEGLTSDAYDCAEALVKEGMDRRKAEEGDGLV